MTILLLAITVLLLTTSPLAEAGLMAILGVVGTYITQFLKRYSGTGNRALILTIAVSAGLAFAATWMVGEWNAENVIDSIVRVFALSTVAYRLLLSEDRIIQPEEPLPPTPPAV